MVSAAIYRWYPGGEVNADNGPSVVKTPWMKYWRRRKRNPWYVYAGAGIINSSRRPTAILVLFIESVDFGSEFHDVFPRAKFALRAMLVLPVVDPGHQSLLSCADGSRAIT